MLHAAELEGRNQHEVELAERIRDCRVVLEPSERGRVQIEDRLAVARDLRGIGLAMEHRNRRSALGGLGLEPPGGKREEVGRNRRRLAPKPLRGFPPPPSLPGAAPLVAPRALLGASRASVPRAFC